MFLSFELLFLILYLKTFKICNIFLQYFLKSCFVSQEVLMDILLKIESWDVVFVSGEEKYSPEDTSHPRRLDSSRTVCFTGVKL
jgi:hypothetical protein